MDDMPLSQREDVIDLAPASVHQYIECVLARLMAETLPEMLGLLRVRGRISDLGKISGRMRFGAQISDEAGNSFRADIPDSLIRGRNIQAQQMVVVTGRFRIRSNAWTIEPRLEISDISPLESELVVAPERATGGATLTHLRSLRPQRRPFPAKDRIAVYVIHSGSSNAQVPRDCGQELEKVSALDITYVPVNILDAQAVAMEIRRVAPLADVLLLIRGGGAEGDFAVFDDVRVVDAFASAAAYRVVGLGHSNNWTALDLLADSAQSTPAQAGQHVRQVVEQRAQRRQSVMDQIKLVERQRDQVKEDLQRQLERVAANQAGSRWQRLVYALLGGALGVGLALLLVG